MVRCEAIAYGGWQRCVRLTDGEQELIATTQVGPRIIRLSFVGEPNLFWEHPLQLGKTGGEEWRIYGGTSALARARTSPPHLCTR
jgi:hypothetical protein